MVNDGKTPENSDVKAPGLHPAYTVTNIQNKIRTLDGSKVTYSSWVKLFRLQAKAYKVSDHLDADPPEKTADDYDHWAEIDALVLQWIYSTVSDEIMAMIIENDTTARTIWKKIHDIFLSNKGSRAAALEHEFTNLQLTACSSMDEYCQKLKDLAEQLADVDNPVSEARLVLQLVRGLPMEYDVVGTFINQSSPTWDVARSMLQLEIHRQKARQNPTNTAMVSPQAPQQSQPSSNHGQFFQQNNPQKSYDTNRNRGRGRNTWRGGGRNSNRGGRGRGSGNNSCSQHRIGQQPNWWAPPPCPYPSQNSWPTSSQIAYLLLYVDDIVLTASNIEFLKQIINDLSTEFAMTDLGPLHHFLGIKVTRDKNGLFLSQEKYARDIIHRASMSSCKPCATPVDTNAKLSAHVGDPLQDGTLYRSLAGALQYLTFTRPDISYAVQQVCLFMHAPRQPHFQFMKRIIRYLQGTIDHGLHISTSSNFSLTAYSDADWGGCPDTRRSTSGYCVFMGNNLISWSSKRQHTISRSSAEAEYRGVANAVAEVSWLRNLLLELHVPVTKATIVYCDNVSAVYLSENPVQHQRTKHVEMDIHFVREKVQIGHIRVLHIPSSLQYADIFTKGLPRHLFQMFRSSLSIHSTPAPTAGVY
ncbi:hypothetical protein L2E82_50138 [Cichorium intybus]|nr:hypothetical protein L2E82_50138 [Cichorium intybus]